MNEFHKAGGLSQLVALGKEDEAQLQNFILRSNFLRALMLLLIVRVILVMMTMMMMMVMVMMMMMMS